MSLVLCDETKFLKVLGPELCWMAAFLSLLSRIGRKEEKGKRILIYEQNASSENSREASWQGLAPRVTGRRQSLFGRRPIHN